MWFCTSLIIYAGVDAPAVIPMLKFSPSSRSFSGIFSLSSSPASEIRIQALQCSRQMSKSFAVLELRLPPMTIIRSDFSARRTALCWRSAVALQMVLNTSASGHSDLMIRQHFSHIIILYVVCATIATFFLKFLNFFCKISRSSSSLPQIYGVFWQCLTIPCTSSWSLSPRMMMSKPSPDFSDTIL